MNFPYWTLPTLITLWMGLWVYLGYRGRGTFAMQLRLVGAVLLSIAVWLIWYLMDGVKYFYGA